MQYLCRQPQLTDTVCLPNKLAIFQISSAQYFQYSSHYSPRGSCVLHGEIMCLHVVINFLQPPERDQNMLHLSPYHMPILNSVKFHENTEIPRKRANFAA